MTASRTLLLRLLAPLVGLSLLVGACSDDDEPEDEGSTQVEEGAPSAAATAEIDDPCERLTAADLEARFDSPFNEGDLTDQAETGSRQCTWTNIDAPPAKTFTIVVGNDDSLSAAFGRDAAEFFALTRNALDTSKSIDDPDLGLGDESYLAGTYVYVLEGSTTYTFATFLGESPEAIAGLTELATKVIDG